MILTCITFGSKTLRLWLGDIPVDFRRYLYAQNGCWCFVSVETKAPAAGKSGRQILADSSIASHPLGKAHWGKHIGGQSMTNEIAIDPQSCKDQRPLGRSRW
jgi:hypothetical protein